MRQLYGRHYFFSVVLLGAVIQVAVSISSEEHAEIANVERDALNSFPAWEERQKDLFDHSPYADDSPLDRLDAADVYTGGGDRYNAQKRRIMLGKRTVYLGKRREQDDEAKKRQIMLGKRPRSLMEQHEPVNRFGLGIASARNERYRRGSSSM